jgi:hypothetical protein
MGDQWSRCIVSGINIAVAGAGTASGTIPDPDSGPLELTFYWNGATPLNVSGVSGQTGFPNFFYTSITGGVEPFKLGVSITNNPSGKFSLFTLGSQIGIAWNNMSVNESQIITVKYDITDSAGTSRSSSASAAIKRIS